MMLIRPPGRASRPSSRSGAIDGAGNWEKFRNVTSHGVAVLHNIISPSRQFQTAAGYVLTNGRGGPDNSNYSSTPTDTARVAGLRHGLRATLAWMILRIVRADGDCYGASGGSTRAPTETSPRATALNAWPRGPPRPEPAQGTRYERHVPRPRGRERVSHALGYMAES